MQTMIFQVIVGCLFIATSTAFLSRTRLYMTSTENTKLSIVKGKVWPGNRPPVPNPMLLEQKMDASWGRGKFRTEVWEDDVNPWNFWWEAYAPSEETLEAIQLGFDFTNPREWLEKRGINYDQAMEETKKATEIAYKEYKNKQEASLKKIQDMGIEKFKEEFFEMERLAFEYAFRSKDDEEQLKKGQVLLNDEDTGKQWHNDPIQQ